jgi:Tfp pilus assembly protein PilF
MANSLLMLGQIDQGEKHLRNALAINPNAAAVHHRLGQIASMRRDYQSALESYRVAVAIDPKLGVAHADYGTLLATVGRVQEAVSELQLALQTLPAGDLSGRSLVEMNIGRLLERTGQPMPAAERYMSAVNLAEQAVAKRPNDATTHLQLASTLQYTGQSDKARAAADKAMELAVKSNNQVLIAQLRSQFKHFPPATQPTTAPATQKS